MPERITPASPWENGHHERMHGAIFDPARLSAVLITAGNIGALVIVAAYARRIGRDRRDAQRKLFLQAWHLRNLLPQSRDLVPG